jgi:hypothetical protein
MEKTAVKTGGETQSSFFNVKAYSVSEILAAGGITAFANQMGKNTQQPLHS